MKGLPKFGKCTKFKIRSISGVSLEKMIEILDINTDLSYLAKFSARAFKVISNKYLCCTRFQDNGVEWGQAKRSRHNIIK